MDSKNKLAPVDLFFTFYEPSNKLNNATNKPPIIFIHGILASPYGWNKVKNHIANRTGRKVYAIGMRNHRSSGWSDEFSVDHIAADLENFMMQEKIPKAILIAHSLGGRAAIKFAIEKPNMVEKLIIEDMTFTMDEQQYQTGQQFRSILSLPNMVEKLIIEDMTFTMDEQQYQTGQQFRSILSLPNMVEKLIIEDMTFTMDEQQYQTGQQFRSILSLAKNAVEQFPPSLSEEAAQKKLQQLFTFAFCKKQGGQNISRPPKIPLPFRKDKSGKFVWDINMDAVLNSLTNADNFHTALSADSVYLGETLFTSGEYSTIPVFKDKELILKHFPNSKIVCAKNVYHNYHLEKPDEYVNEITKFIGV